MHEALSESRTGRPSPPKVISPVKSVRAGVKISSAKGRTRSNVFTRGEHIVKADFCPAFLNQGEGGGVRLFR